MLKSVNILAGTDTPQVACSRQRRSMQPIGCSFSAWHFEGNKLFYKRIRSGLTEF